MKQCKDFMESFMHVSLQMDWAGLLPSETTKCRFIKLTKSHMYQITMNLEVR